MMQYTAIAKDGGLFIPNINQFSDNMWVQLEISQMVVAPQNTQQDNLLNQVVGILKDVDGVAFQNSLREE